LLKAYGASLLVSYFNGEDGMALVLLIVFEVFAIVGGIFVWQRYASTGFMVKEEKNKK